MAYRVYCLSFLFQQCPIPRIIRGWEWVGFQDHGLRVFGAVHRDNIEDKNDSNDGRSRGADSCFFLFRG